MDSNYRTGIAIKRSHFRNIRDFLDAIIYTDQYHDFVFLDYEGMDLLLTPDQLRTILGQIRSKFVFTVSIRSAEFYSRKYLLERYLRIADIYPNLLFCVVAGHPAYSSVDPRIPVRKAFYNILARIRSLTSSNVFLGVENLSTSLVEYLTKRYGSVIPFLIHGDSRAATLNALRPPYAVYTPLSSSLVVPLIKSDEIAMQHFIGYLLRRKSVRRWFIQAGINPSFLPTDWHQWSTEEQSILTDAYYAFVLTKRKFQDQIQTFTTNGAFLIVGHPTIPSFYLELIRAFHQMTTRADQNVVEIENLI